MKETNINANPPSTLAAGSARRFLRWTCPECGETLEDPAEDTATECHSHHQVNLFYDEEADRLIARLVRQNTELSSGGTADKRQQTEQAARRLLK